MSKKSKHYWNYRIITFKQYIDDTKFEQLFSVAEVYYENDKPNSHGDKFILNSFESLKGLKWINKKIQKAFKKPVLDIDNNYKKWKKK